MLLIHLISSVALLLSIVASATFSHAIGDYSEIIPKDDLMAVLCEELNGQDPHLYAAVQDVDSLEMASAMMHSFIDSNYNSIAVRLVWLKAMDMPDFNTSPVMWDMFWKVTDTLEDLSLLKDLADYCRTPNLGEPNGIIAKYISLKRLDQLDSLPVSLRDNFRELPPNEAMFFVKEQIIIPLLSHHPINHPRSNWNFRVQPRLPVILRVTLHCHLLCKPNKYLLDFIDINHSSPAVYKALDVFCREMHIPIFDEWLLAQPQWTQAYTRVVLGNRMPTEEEWYLFVSESKIELLQNKKELDYANHSQKSLFDMVHHLFGAHRDWMLDRRNDFSPNAWNLYRWYHPGDAHFVPRVYPDSPNIPHIIRSLIPRISFYPAELGPLFLELVEKYGLLDIESAMVKDGSYNKTAFVCLRLSDPNYFVKYGEYHRHNIVTMMYLVNNLPLNAQVEWLFFLMRRSDPLFVHSLKQK